MKHSYVIIVCYDWCHGFNKEIMCKNILSQSKKNVILDAMSRERFNAIKLCKI